GSPGVLKQRHSFTDQRHPLANVQQGKNDARGSGNKGPAESSRFVARLGGLDSKQHSQAAGHEDERHQRNVGDVVERSRPVGSGVADKSIGPRHAAKVAVSAMMNSHIAIFFAGTENAGPAVRPAVGPPIVKSAWLTGASLLLLELAKASSTAATADIPKARP